MRARTLLTVMSAALLVAGCGGSAIESADGQEAPQQAPEADEDFDRDEHKRQAEALLGIREGEISEDRLTRVLRRGEEDVPATLDLQPGRRNLELDRDDTGTFVVTRVTVEVPDGVEPIVVEEPAYAE